MLVIRIFRNISCLAKKTPAVSRNHQPVSDNITSHCLSANPGTRSLATRMVHPVLSNGRMGAVGKSLYNEECDNMSTLSTWVENKYAWRVYARHRYPVDTSGVNQTRLLKLCNNWNIYRFDITWLKIPTSVHLTVKIRVFLELVNRV